MDFSKNKIGELRKSKNLTQHQLAKITGIKQANISRWEHNIIIPNVLDCYTLANYFGVSVEYLLGA